MIIRIFLVNNIIYLLNYMYYRRGSWTGWRGRVNPYVPQNHICSLFLAKSQYQSHFPLLVIPSTGASLVLLCEKMVDKFRVIFPFKALTKRQCSLRCRLYGSVFNKCLFNLTKKKRRWREMRARGTQSKNSHHHHTSFPRLPFQTA